MQSEPPPTRTATGTPPVRIEKLVYGGEGLGRIDGQVVLVPFVLPQEQVLVTTERVKRGLLRGSALTVLEPSPERSIPRCEYFGTCGGCHYQHAEYAFELEQKRQILLETLLRGSGIRYHDEIRIISGDPWFYRNRIQLHFSEDMSGFHQAGSHRVCAIDHCYIASPVLVEVIGAFRKAVARPEWPAFLRTLEVFTNGNEIQLTVVEAARPVAARFFEWCRQFLPSSTGDPIRYPAAGFDFQISRRSFFQVNRHLIEALVEEVNGNAAGAEAIDLYSGVGLFSLPLSRRFQTVTAVERGGSAFHDLEWNISHAGTNIRVARASALEFLADLQQAPDLVVADPPRAGLGPDVTGELLRLRPAKLVLVSCDPATMARDVKRLLTAYRIERLTLVDLFPRIYHFETVVHMQRESTG
jgi:23S rRNA (uracil1939-C5)-methyltransferase